MLGRRATVTVTALALTVCGGGAAFAATHGSSSQRPTQHATPIGRLRQLRSSTQHMHPHVCHPGLKGSMVDTLAY